MINVAKLLKDAPKGMKLYSPLFGEVKFLGIDSVDSTIIVETKRETHEWFSACGKYKVTKSHLLYSDAECLLFPSKDCRTWEGWTPCVEPKFKVGDRVIFNGIVRTITFMDEVYYDFDGGVAGCRIELQDELKYASNFKKGDLLIHNSNPICIVLVVGVSEKYGYQLQGGGGKYHLSFTTVENEYHLWTIADAKDGDILMSDKGNPFIFCEDRIHAGYHNIIAYCGINTMGNFCESSRKECWTYGTSLKPATKKQRDLLFRKMKEAGYQWDADKKELRKIQPHYDIANFKPFDKVLIRVGNKSKWTCDFFSYYHKGFHCIGTDDWSQCIPFEDGTKHLLGTTDMPSEEYINW